MKMTFINYPNALVGYSNAINLLRGNIMSCCGGCGGQDLEETKKTEETEQQDSE